MEVCVLVAAVRSPGISDLAASSCAGASVNRGAHAARAMLVCALLGPFTHEKKGLAGFERSHVVVALVQREKGAWVCVLSSLSL